MIICFFFIYLLHLKYFNFSLYVKIKLINNFFIEIERNEQVFNQCMLVYECAKETL